jgi:hypothetical protein
MKIKRTNPCAECPFRKISPKGWLGPWTTDGILAQAHSEAGLACHVDVNKKAGKLSAEELRAKAHVCVGSLQSANKSAKIYRNPKLNQMQKDVGTSDQILSLFEFRGHHCLKKGG